ncbi:MAG: succinate dehydrogenase, hydrophobic membrane anchor protein [Gammaproteobacteria bacterium]|nr:succinate dehydrogenase, hydrophobic membrane anchor protein [Gammaproteobacteria bacterium]
MNDYRSPLSRVKGLGSAKDGTSHFWHQRLTALALIPLVLWFCFGLASLPADYQSLTSYIQQPVVATGLILLIAMVFYHAQLGLQIVLEDYVSSHSIRTITIIITGFVCLFCALIGIVAVIKILVGA